MLILKNYSFSESIIWFEPKFKTVRRKKVVLGKYKIGGLNVGGGGKFLN